MGGNSNSGALLDALDSVYPQYPVSRAGQNHFKLCDFPLVSQISLLY